MKEPALISMFVEKGRSVMVRNERTGINYYVCRERKERDGEQVKELP